MHGHPFRIVAIGGGTGLSTLLRGLREHVGADSSRSIAHLSAIVTVTDEGGSSGVLRRELSMLPPGDIRNCIVALAEEEQLLSQLFNYRFDNDSAALKGHSLGNLLLAALTSITGSFESAIIAASEVLAIRGEILPSTLADVRLHARCADGAELFGELEISGTRLGEHTATPVRHERIVHLAIEPPDAEPPDRAIEAIRGADMIVIGPGSLYTSLLPNLLIPKLAAEIRRARALRVLVCNVMTQPGETDDYSAEDHVDALLSHAGPVVDVVVLNGRRPSNELLRTYEALNQRPVTFDTDALHARGVIPFFGDVIAHGNLVRHDPAALVDTLFRLYEKNRNGLPTPLQVGPSSTERES